MRVCIDIEIDERETAALQRIAENINSKSEIIKSESRIAAELLKFMLSRLQNEHNAILGVVSCHKDFYRKDSHGEKG